MTTLSRGNGRGKKAYARLTSTDLYDLNIISNETLKEHDNPPNNNSIKTSLSQSLTLYKQECYDKNTNLLTQTFNAIASPNQHINERNRNEEQENKKKDMKKTTTTTLEVVASPYECLEKYTKLSYDEKKSLMIYAEPTVLKALEWVQPEKVKQSLIGLLHWYCRQKVPPEKSSPPGTEQQIEAWQYNQFLKEHSINDLYEKNLLAIPDNHAYVILDVRETTISLNNLPHQVRLELEQSKRELIKLYNLN
ncbi:MAG TPA: hypothetical protein VJK54_01445 [Chthoniobacterales bacterium]|nr:hypothetical protein [Chthoniobacterales bacterium]